MVARIGENDEKLAEILNEIDDRSVYRALDKKKSKLAREKIGVLLKWCALSHMAKYELIRDYAKYVPIQERKTLEETYKIKGWLK